MKTPVAGSPTRNSSPSWRIESGRKPRRLCGVRVGAAPARRGGARGEGRARAGGGRGGRGGPARATHAGARGGPTGGGARLGARGWAGGGGGGGGEEGGNAGRERESGHRWGPRRGL